MNSKKIDRFIAIWGKNKSEQSRKLWRSRLNVYFKTLKIKDIDKYLSSEQNYAQDIIKFIEAKQMYAPLTTRATISTVKLFLEFNDIELKQQTKMAISASLYGAKTVVNNIAPTNKQLKKILEYSSDPLEKALFLTIAHGGLRLNEALSIEIDDVDLNSDPPVIKIKKQYAKFEKFRWAFLSIESKNAVDAWLKVRKQYLKDAVNNYHFSRIYNKKLSDKRLFPISKDGVEKRWRKLLSRSNLDQQCTKTMHKLVEMRIHSLRRFFKSRMESAGLQEAIVNKLVGHKFYMDEYSVHELDELKERYKEGESLLLLYDVNKEVKEMHEEHRKEMDTLRTQVAEQSEILKNLNIETLRKLIMKLKGKSLDAVIEEFHKHKDISYWEDILARMVEVKKEEIKEEEKELTEID